MFNKTIIFVSTLFVALIMMACSQSNTPVDDNSRHIAPAIEDPPEGLCDYSTVHYMNELGELIDTGLLNVDFGDGTCLASLMADCFENPKNHGDFVSCMAHLTNRLKKAGLITNKEKGDIMSWAAQSDIGKK